MCWYILPICKGDGNIEYRLDSAIFSHWSQKISKSLSKFSAAYHPFGDRGSGSHSGGQQLPKYSTTAEKSKTANLMKRGRMS